MLKALLRIRFASLFSSMMRSKKGEAKMSVGKKILFGVLWLYVGVVFLFMFGMLFYELRSMLNSTFSWFYFSFTALLSFFFCFIGSVFVTQSQLFDASDNELLLAMPIPPQYILMSRMLLLLILNYIYEAVIFVPSIVIYISSGALSLSGMLLFILTYLFLPLLSLSVSCLFGWLLALISSRLRRKNIIQVIAMVIFLCAYFYFYQNIQQYINVLLYQGAKVAEAIRKALPPFYYLGDAIASGSLLSFLWFLLFCLLPMTLTYWLLSRFFIRIATSNRGLRKITYRRKELHVSSVSHALLIRDLRFFVSLPAYMMNAAIGILFCFMITGFLILQKETFLPFLMLISPSTKDAAGIVVCLLLSFCATTNIITAPSISLEGNRLWILKSLPVPSRSILLSKVRMHCLVCIPPIILCSLVGCIVLGSSALGYALAILVPSTITLFTALLGVVINLHMPKFDWLNETVCVKQSGSTMLTMFGVMALLFAPILLYVLLLNFIPLTLYLTICFLVILLGCLGLYLYLVRRGTLLFEKLQN